jgi:hypothetical protein
MPFTLNTVIPWGRSFVEYCSMFALTEADLTGRILGCGDGPASFNAEATGRGASMVSCDPLYQFSGGQIEKRIEETYRIVLEQLHENRDGFVWSTFSSPEEVGEVRLAAMRRFLADYPAGKNQGRYVEAGLPKVPFTDGAFDLALCSHFLFLYSAQHDADFHMASIVELGRVAREVRIFPVVDLAGVLSPHLDVITAKLLARKWHVERVGVDYEFQRGANEMLRLLPPASIQ